MQTHEHDLETIAAFIDGERVDPQALKQALANEQGRDYLVELVAIRELVGTPTTAVLSPSPVVEQRTNWRGLALAAAVTLAVGLGSYALGHVSAERRIAAAQEAANKAPTPTREIAPDSSTSWTETSGGTH